MNNMLILTMIFYSVLIAIAFMSSNLFFILGTITATTLSLMYLTGNKAIINMLDDFGWF